MITEATTSLITDVITDDLNTNAQDYLTFNLGDEVFGINILFIKEIIEYGKITVVPQMPKFLAGIINLRGRVVPVVNLSLRLGKPALSAQKKSCIVVAEVKHDSEIKEIGVIVDSVSEVLRIAATSIDKIPAFGAKLPPDFVFGIAKIDNTFSILIDPERVLSFEEIAAISASATLKSD